RRMKFPRHPPAKGASDAASHSAGARGNAPSVRCTEVNAGGQPKKRIGSQQPRWSVCGIPGYLLLETESVMPCYARAGFGAAVLLGIAVRRDPALCRTSFC